MSDDLAILEDGIAALGLTLPAGVAERLIRYRDLLLKWNRVYNLTSIRHPTDVISHHLLDALAIVPWLDRILAEAALSPEILDVGSGAGLPGIPLALARPHLRVTLVDAVQKKTAFQQQAVIDLGISNVTPRHGRVETLAGCHAIIVSRAFAELGKLAALTRHLVAPGGFWLAMKGQYPGKELTDLPAGICLRATEMLSVPGLSAKRHLAILFQSHPNHAMSPLRKK
jgi:16S rRNA (guanine527-N7)-methyltransferase